MNEEHNRRASDRVKPLQERAIDYVMKNGPFAVLAAVLLYFLLGTLKDANASLAKTTQDTLLELRSHVSESNWLNYQVCVNTAIQAGRPTELCRSPQAPERPR